MSEDIKKLMESIDRINEYGEYRDERNIRDEVIAAVDEGMIDKDYLITAMLKYMSSDDVKDMLRANDIDLNFDDEYDESVEHQEKF